MRRSTYSVTSCSGLMMTSTERPPGRNSSGRLAYSAARMRAILVGVRKSVKATSQATRFTSSLEVSATMISASAAPAASSTVGCAALPATVRTSRRSCTSRSTSSLRSTTVTSLASSRDSACAAVRPTWPAPSMRIFMRALTHALQGGEVGILHHQPLGTLALEAYLYPGVRAVALDIEDHPVAELAVPHPRAQAHAPGRGLLGGGAEAPDGHRARHLHPRAHLFQELLGDLADEARGLAVGVDAVQAALLGAGEIQLPHGACHADITQAPLLLEAL